MSKVWIAAALAAVAVGGAVGYALVKARTPDLSPAGPNRDLAPDSLSCYAEIADGAGLWTKMRGTEAWNDLAASKIAAAVTQGGPVKEFLAALDQIAAKANYRIDATNAMKLVGREVSVGVKLDPAGGVPNVLVLTKLDTAALSKDLLSGDTDLDKLWAEMQRRTGSLDFKVTASEHRGQKMAAATRGEASYHAALLGDTLAVATDVALVRAAIDCRLDGGAKSIGRRADFQADLKALPAGATVVEWYDLDALDAGRASLDAGIARFTDKPAALGAVHAILDGTKGAHTLARATVMPEGDLYRLSWAYSKSDELFADRASPSVPNLLPGDWAAYCEFRQIGGLADAWRRSSVRKNLAAGELGRWIDEAMDDPSSKLGRVAGLFGPSAVADEIDLEDEDAPPKTANPAALLSAMGDRFTSKMAKHLFEQWLAALTKGEGAIAVDVVTDGQVKARVACAVRLDTDGRLLALAIAGALQSAASAEIKSETSGTRTVWSQSGDGAERPHWTLVGDTLFIGNDGELVRAAARSGPSAAAPEGTIAKAMSGLKPGWRVALAYDLERMMRALNERSGGRRHGGPDVDRMFDMYREAGLYSSSGAFAVYVPDDFAAIEFQARGYFEPATTDGGRALRAANAESREPRCWSCLPDSTILHVSAPAAGVSTLYVAVKALAGIAGAEPGAIESGFRDAMKMDFDKEFFPALGREFFFAVTFKAGPADAKPDEPPPTVVPGVVLGIEVKDAAVVKKALDRAIELGEEALRDSPNAPMQSPFVRESYDGVDLVRVEMPGERLPFQPACAMHEGFLILALDVSELRACVDVSKGKAPRLADTPLFAAATAELGRKGASFSLIDWNRLADQVAVYAPMLAPAVASPDIPYPDFPENGDQDEWKRRVDEYQKKMADGRGSGEAKVRRWIDAFRVIEYIGGVATWSGDVSDSKGVVRFRK